HGSLLLIARPPSVVADRGYPIAKAKKSATGIVTKGEKEEVIEAGNRHASRPTPALSPPRSGLVQLVISPTGRHDYSAPVSLARTTSVNCAKEAACRQQRSTLRVPHRRVGSWLPRAAPGREPVAPTPTRSGRTDPRPQLFLMYSRCPARLSTN